MAVAIVGGLWAHRRPFPDAIARLHEASDSAAMVIRRATVLRAFVPPQGAVGYINGGNPLPDSFIPPLPPATVRALAHYKLTQYALAPTLVLPGENFPLIVGDFSGVAPDTTLLSKRGFWVVRDLGAGLMLLAQRSVR